MGKLLCEKKLRDVWCRNESVRADIGQILQTHTHAAKLVVEIVDVRVESPSAKPASSQSQ